MSTITWKNADLSGQTYYFEIENEKIGTLILQSELSSHAHFITSHGSLRFKRVGFLENKVILTKNEEVIGEIGNRLFGQTFLKLKKGNTFRLSSNLLGRNLKWIDTEGHTVMQYSFATLNSRGKGSISTDPSLTLSEKEILMSSGLVAGKFNAYRLSFFFLLFCFSAYWISKFI